MERNSKGDITAFQPGDILSVSGLPYIVDDLSVVVLNTAIRLKKHPQSEGNPLEKCVVSLRRNDKPFTMQLHEVTEIFDIYPVSHERNSESRENSCENS